METLDMFSKKRFNASTNKLNFWRCSARTVILDKQTKEYNK